MVILIVFEEQLTLEYYPEFSVMDKHHEMTFL